MTPRILLLPVLFALGCGAPPEASVEPAEPAAPTAEAPPPAPDRGAEVFAANCAVCHGPEGRGDGPGAAGLEPPPPDLVGPRVAHLKGIPRRQIIEEGRPGTAMVGWRAILSPEDLEAVYGVVHDMKHGPQAAPPDPEHVAQQRARMAMQRLGETLKTQLVSTMKAQGPVAAMEVCSTTAQSMTKEVAQAEGVALGRSSSRLRNPDNAAPDWVAAWLSEQGERAAEGTPGLVQSGTREDGTPVVRVLKPLAVEAPCLVCHGPDEGRAPALSAALAERYPDDEATGYALGDLRGALWAEAELELP